MLYEVITKFIEKRGLMPKPVTLNFYAVGEPLPCLVCNNSSVGFLIHKVAPAPNTLRENKARRGNIQHLPDSDPAPKIKDERRNRTPDDPSVYRKTAFPHA